MLWKKTTISIENNCKLSQLAGQPRTIEETFVPNENAYSIWFQNERKKTKLPQIMKLIYVIVD